MEEDNEINKDQFYDLPSYCNYQPTNSKPELYNTNTEIIQKSDNYCSYICSECKKSPLIELYKDMKNIIYTCSCSDNKIISIKEFLDNNINKNLTDLLSSTSEIIVDDPNEENENLILHDNIEGVICTVHNQKFEYFCKTCLVNICSECLDNHGDKKLHHIIEFKNIIIDKNKIKQLINDVKINDNTNINISSSDKSEYQKSYYIYPYKSELLKLTQKEKKEYHQLINIIIDNYKFFPNYVHFCNMQNILDFHYKFQKIKTEETKDIKDKNKSKESTVMKL